MDVVVVGRSANNAWEAASTSSLPCKTPRNGARSTLPFLIPGRPSSSLSAMRANSARRHSSFVTTTAPTTAFAATHGAVRSSQSPTSFPYSLSVAEPSVPLHSRALSRRSSLPLDGAFLKALACIGHEPHGAFSPMSDSTSSPSGPAMSTSPLSAACSLAAVAAARSRQLSQESEKPAPPASTSEFKSEKEVEKEKESISSLKVLEPSTLDLILECLDALDASSAAADADSRGGSPLAHLYSASLSDASIFSVKTFERIVEHLEIICAALLRVRTRLTDAIAVYYDRQNSPLQSALSLFEVKNSHLTAELSVLKSSESSVRETIDRLAHDVEKAKKTVHLGQSLALSTSKQHREMVKLDHIRLERDAELAELEKIVTQRTIAQNQMLNVSTIASEFTADVDRRDYKFIYKQMANSFFAMSFGTHLQTTLIHIVKEMASARKSARGLKQTLEHVNGLITQLRGKTNELIAINWK